MIECDEFDGYVRVENFQPGRPFFSSCHGGKPSKLIPIGPPIKDQDSFIEHRVFVIGDDGTQYVAQHIWAPNISAARNTSWHYHKEVK